MPVETLAADQKKTILDAHNDLRKKEGSKEMKKLEWNDVLAEMAQGFANECKFAHGQPASPKAPFEYVGQNVYAKKPYSEPVDLKAVTLKWFSEKANYDYENSKCSSVCGHYTQVSN